MSRLPLIMPIIYTLILLFLSSASFCKTEPTLKQKIGQMVMIGFPQNKLEPNYPIVHDIKDGKIGGVVLFDYNFRSHTFNHNIKNPAQLKKLTKELQLYAKVPLLIGIDYEGGKVNRLKPKYGFPAVASAETLGKQGRNTAKKQAELMARTLNSVGVNLDFAPVTDVNINPNSPAIGAIGRSFSANPEKVASFSKIFSNTFSKHKILCSYKHFPGHGSATNDSHLGFVDVTNTWQPQELIPYKKLLNNKNSCGIVMVAHILNNKLDPSGHPASLSYPVITKLLRNKLNFKGVVITDDLQMKAITGQYSLEKTIELAIMAGADILVFGNQLGSQVYDGDHIVNIIYADVTSGKIPKERINSSWKRIMQLKQQI